MKRVIAALSISLGLGVSSAHAANHVLTLTGDMANLTTNAFTAGGVLY